MNRCPCLPTAHAPAWRAGLFAAVLLFANASFAQESVRAFPKNAVRGVLQVTQTPELLLNGQFARLSPGARIHAVNNLLILSASLTGQSLQVNYVRDLQGMVHEVWLLNATEAQQRMPDASTQSNYLSNYPPTATDGSPPASGTSSPSPQ